jgi:predicted MFS family arabinose efflux permease
MPELRPAYRTVVPGAAMVAVSFGLARYGYGLLLPQMRVDLGIGASTAGLVASGSYVSYLAANTAVVWLLGRFGARVAVALAAVTATAGMTILGLARDVTSLTVGVLVAGCAAGFAFPPYADIVADTVEEGRRPGAWSMVSSGTGWGVALAGPAAILLGSGWRSAWLVFAALAALVGVVAVAAAPAHARRTTDLPGLRWSWFVCPRSRPLLVSSVLVGLGSSVWWAFSVDALDASGVGRDTARAVYALCGAAGVLASFTGVAVGRYGLRRYYLGATAVLVVALATLGLLTTSLPAVVVAAVLFGVSYQGVIASQGLWNAAVFAERPSAGLAAVNTALTVGTIAGPAVGGVVINAFGYLPVLLLASACVAAAALQAPPVASRRLVHAGA